MLLFKRPVALTAGISFFLRVSQAEVAKHANFGSMANIWRLTSVMVRIEAPPHPPMKHLETMSWLASVVLPSVVLSCLQF